nr:PREDICTED: uncharacterized protein LOC105678053 isoform X1 [Linepithema humile]
MFGSIFVFFLFAMVLASETNLNRSDLKCEGTAYHNVSVSAYYCPWCIGKRNHKDIRGILARPLQKYLDNRGKFVTVAGNINSGISYGTKVCIEELNEHFGMRIPLEIRDQIIGGRKDVQLDFSGLEICVNNVIDSLNSIFDSRVTIYV